MEFGLDSRTPMNAYFVRFGQVVSLDFCFHQGYQINVVLSGKLYTQFEDTSFTIGSGDVRLCSMWESHGWAIPSTETFLVGVLFLPEFLGDESFDGISWLSMFAVPPKERPRVTTDEIRSAMLAIGHELAREITTRSCAWETMVRLNALKILLLLRRNWKPKTLSRQTRKLRTNDLSLILPVLEILHSDPTRIVKVAEAAKACGLGKYTFAEKFQHAMGMTFRRFQVRARLGLVAQRLIATELSVEALAHETGFVDTSHLVHAFTKYYNCTPSQYRQQAR